MDYLHDWANLLLRWGHLIVGVAWIGASFYFNWLENHLERQNASLGDGVAGELWAIHGGGFYHLQKYELAPPSLPEPLHWFKWEAYTTFLTGFALLWVVYYLNAGTMLLPPGSTLVPWQGVLLGLGVVFGAWFVYDALCRSPLGRRPAWLAMVGFVLLIALTWGLMQVFSGRAAYLHVGAAIGTCMVANVFRVIIPGQKALVSAMQTGAERDPAHGRHALLRSRHNNYLTLPVLFLMISNHYPMTYASEWGWLVLAGLMVFSVLVRHYFNVRHLAGRKVWVLPAAGLALVTLMAAMVPEPAPSRQAAGNGAPEVAFGEVAAIVEERCAGCHAAEPSFGGFAAAPAGVALDTGEQIRRHLKDIQRVAVTSRYMPLGNVTGMTDVERATLGAFIAAPSPAPGS
ncbi:urate hydroxylase PuuD [Halomonas sp. YLGW01]|uniref:urate hydroxylase PuuD n=1 Tax=Halomonas sp. YLGW01 TaxID=2773308 RepID=UPI001781A911|nr:urate hydroxylase PuuD [Halomonas sp. YLGW01]